MTERTSEATNRRRISLRLCLLAALATAGAGLIAIAAIPQQPPDAAFRARLAGYGANVAAPAPDRPEPSRAAPAPSAADP